MVHPYQQPPWHPLHDKTNEKQDAWGPEERDSLMTGAGPYPSAVVVDMGHMGDGSRGKSCRRPHVGRTL